MHDYMRFLMHGAEDVGKAKGKYRCRCLVQNEYMEFAWFEEGMDPHIVDGCSKFEEYELEGTPKRPEQRPRPGKRERQDPMDKDAAGKEPSL